MRLNESRSSVEDQLSKAFTLYKEQDPKSEEFSFIQCFHVLKDRPKFWALHQGKPGFPSIENPIDLSQDDVPNPLGVKGARSERSQEGT